MFWTWLSEKLNERFLLATISQIWVVPCLAAFIALPSTRSPWANYALSVLTFAMPYVHAIFVAITSRNAGSVRTRTVATAIYNMSYVLKSMHVLTMHNADIYLCTYSVQASNVIGINIYRSNDAPYYFTANKVRMLCSFHLPNLS